MEYLSEKYGLVTTNDPVTENGQLFLAELILLKKYNFCNPDEIVPLNDLMQRQLNVSKVEDGLYLRNPDLVERCTSHDNLSGIFSWAFATKNPVRFSIWNYLLRHLGTYDSSGGKSKQFSRLLPFNPSNFFVWGLCAESRLYLLFFPFYLVNFILTILKPKEDTSGKLLTFVELFPHRDHWLAGRLFKIFCSKVKVINSFAIYFGMEPSDFPIKKELGLK